MIELDERVQSTQNPNCKKNDIFVGSLHHFQYDGVHEPRQRTASPTVNTSWWFLAPIDEGKQIHKQIGEDGIRENHELFAAEI